MADPKTCRHNVVQSAPGHIVTGMSKYACVSCGLIIPTEVAEKRNYEYDIDRKVFVHRPIKTEQERDPNVKD